MKDKPEGLIRYVFMSFWQRLFGSKSKPQTLFSDQPIPVLSEKQPPSSDTKQVNTAKKSLEVLSRDADPTQSRIEAELKRRADSFPPGLKAMLNNFGGTGISADEVMNTINRIVSEHEVEKVKKAEAEHTFETSGKNIQNIICSDNECPCTDQKPLVLGKDAYLFISPEVVNFRKDCLSVFELEAKLSKMKSPAEKLAAVSYGMPKYVCEKGARRRGLDLAVALADGQAAAQTGWVPLRSTPKAQLQSSASKPQDAIGVDSLVRSLLAQDRPTREKALVEVRGLANSGKRQAVDALEIAIRRKAGQPVEFHVPGFALIPGEQFATARQSVLDIARRGEICKEAKRVGSLMSSLSLSNPDAVRSLLAEISKAGGEEQVHQFQLVGTHLQALAGLKNSGAA